MATDGTDQELLAPFDYGATGSSNAPEWSPDGANVVFHREVAGSPQLFLVDVSGRRVRQLTSAGRNKIRRGDPTAGTSLSSPTGAASGSSGSSTSKPAACAS